ncbi:hypothetical protein BDY21DRAFT_387480 [Lineolata rhizophorae]|uniref:F-box domain-containing protein n=1 Tax=Lineolata rhizophorae TaxID=578093 RepID=A0A6A6NSH4_9PEZI|nr:hypothetical protein BDY21DRAFT_387480 [Lineolata rhizophorae]
MAADNSDAESSVAEDIPFSFFDLPAELRIRIYEMLLVQPKPIDLDPGNPSRLSPLILSLFLTSHRVHEEAYHVFYGRNTFRLFPLHGRFFHSRWPLLARLPRRYRAAITSVDVRLGPGWTAPPKGWRVNRRLGLADCVALRELKVFVEVDPSDDCFRDFRVSKSFYTHFCRDLLVGIMNQVPSIETVEFDAYPAVSRSAPLMSELLTQAKARQKRILWGPERGWKQDTVDSTVENGAVAVA